MTLSFPNRSRSYDTTRKAVRFWGHDTAMGASFFITRDALQRLHCGQFVNEAALLCAFDVHRDLICSVAAKVYLRGHRGSYDVEAADFCIYSQADRRKRAGRMAEPSVLGAV